MSSATISTQNGFTTVGQGSGSLAPKTKCQIELDISWENIESHTAEGEWQKIAPVRILSFDIECAARKGIFPEPEKDPVIQIANMVVRQGEKEPFIKNVFTLEECAPVVGSEVICFVKGSKEAKEAELLKVKYPCILLS